MTAFNIDRQTALKMSVARVAVVSSEDVSIASMEPLSPGTRRLLSESIRAEIHVKAADKATADEIAGRLTAFRINRELAKEGLPAVVVTEPASVQEASTSESASSVKSSPESASSVPPNSGSSIDVIIGFTVTALVLGMIAAYVWQHKILLSLKRRSVSSSQVAPLEAEPETDPASNLQHIEGSVGVDEIDSILRTDTEETDSIVGLMFKEMVHLVHSAPWRSASAWWSTVHEELRQAEGVSTHCKEEAARLLQGFHAEILQTTGRNGNGVNSVRIPVDFLQRNDQNGNGVNSVRIPVDFMQTNDQSGNELNSVRISVEIPQETLQTNDQNRNEFTSVFVHVSSTNLLSIGDVPEVSVDRPVGWAVCAVRPMMLSRTQASRQGTQIGTQIGTRLGTFRFLDNSDDPSNHGESDEWCEATDPRSKEVFYYHTATLETRSDPPADFDPRSDEMLHDIRRVRGSVREAVACWSRKAVFVQLQTSASFADNMGPLIENAGFHARICFARKKCIL